LNFALKGKNLLEFKRDLLIFQIKKKWTGYETHRKSILNLLRKAMIKLNQTYEGMESRDLNLISNMSKILFNPLVKVKYVKNIGNIVPKIDYKLAIEKQFPVYSFENTSVHLDDLIIILKELFESLILFAEKEGVMLKFSFNFKKLNRRINGLENIIIPDLQLEINKIKRILEEIERENFVRLKKTKDLINKSLSVYYK
jgi:H(+)-transporting ATP synthase subunit D